MKVLIDINIFVSAIMNAEGASRAVLRMCLSGALQPLMSNALATEYEDLCARTSLFDHALIPAKVREELLDAFMASCLWVKIYYLWRPNLRDEADNHMIELAIGGGAQIIVTSNKRDFNSAELLFPQLEVRTAAEFLKERRIA